MEQLEDTKLPVGGYEGLKSLLQSKGKLTHSDLSLYQRFIPIEQNDEILQQIATQRNFALLAGKNYIRYQTERKYMDEDKHPRIHVMKECVSTSDVGFIFPIGSKFIRTFDKYLQRIFEAGIPKKLFQDLLSRSQFGMKSTDFNQHKRRKVEKSFDYDASNTDKIGREDFDDGDDEVLQGTTFFKKIHVNLKLTHYRETFLMLLTGFVISVCVFILEHVHSQFCHTYKH